MQIITIRDMALDIINEAIYESEVSGRTMVISTHNEHGVMAVEASEYVEDNAFSHRPAVWFDFEEDHWRLTICERGGKPSTEYLTYEQANKIA